MKNKLIRRLLAAALVLPLLTLLAVYAALRSETFVKEYVLPFVSKQIGQPIRVQQIDIKPLTGVTLTDLRFNCEGTNSECPSQSSFAMRIGSLSVSYDPWALFSKQLSISSLRARDLWVGVTNRESQTATSQPSEQQEAPSTDATSSSSGGLSYLLADTLIDQATFTFSTAGAAETYRLADIAITIPKADSHGESQITISTRASIKSQTLNFENQPLSIAATLLQSDLFKPALIKLEASAGDATPKPIELAGDLIFSKEPYALSKISLSKATVRESLLERLVIPFAPFKEFEYFLEGDYTLGTPALARIDMTVQRGLFIHSSAHDLKGTKLSSKLEIHPNSATISDGSLTLVDSGNSLLASSLTGQVAFDPYTKPSKISLKAPLVNLDGIRALLTQVKPEESLSNTNQPSSAPAPPAAKPQQSTLEQVRLPLITLDAQIDKAIVQKIETSSLNVAVAIPTNRIIEKASLNATFSQGGSLTMNASGSLDAKLAFKASGRDVNMIPFAAAAADSKGEILEGGLKSLDVDISTDGRDPRKSLNGYATLALSRMIVPSTLQEQVPFNILFLPLDALITIFGGAINLMLPASISSISDSIKQTLDEAGRLGLDDSMIDLRFEQGKILFKNVDINTKNLPDFVFKGSITPEDKLDLTVFIALLKLNLPLPIAGTLNSPIPDVAYVGPELIRGLGLSIGSIAGSAASIFSGGKKEDSSKPVGQ